MIQNFKNYKLIQRPSKVPLVQHPPLDVRHLDVIGAYDEETLTGWIAKCSKKKFQNYFEQGRERIQEQIPSHI